MTETERCMEILRKRIREEYKKSRIVSMEKFAIKCKISYNTIWRIISEKNPANDVRLSTLVIMANALGKPVSWLIGEDEERFDLKNVKG